MVAAPSSLIHDDYKRMVADSGLVGLSFIIYIFTAGSSLMMMHRSKQNDFIWLDQQSRISFYNKFQALAQVPMYV
jgi:hypothetical protein